MQIIDYLNRIKNKFCLDDSILIYAFIIFENIIIKNSYNIKIMNFHKLYFVSIMTTLKFLDDHRKFNKKDISLKFFSRVSGIPENELKVLELEFF